MRYLKMFLLFFFITYYNSSANTYNQDSTLFVNKSTEGISKMIYAYMEDYGLTIQTYNEVELSAAEKKGMQLYKSKFIDMFKSYNESPYLLDSIGAFLSKKENNWSSAGLKLFKKLRENYNTELKSKSYNLKAVFDVGDITLVYIKKQNKFVNNKVQWDKMLSDILKVNDKPIDSINKSISHNENIPITANSSNYVNTINRENIDKGSIYLKLIGYIVIFCLGCISVILYFNFKIKDILKEEYEEYKRLINLSDEEYPSFIFGVIKFLKERKNNYRDETNTSFSKTESNDNYRLETLINENKNLVERNRELEKKYLDSSEIPKNNIENNEKTILEQTENLNREEIKNNTLYFSIPEEDGTFLEEKSSISATSRSYFKLEYIENERIGKLIYRSGNLDDSAISQMDYILGPVCEIENSLMKNPTRIIIGSQGTVVKVDGKWKIKDKIKIKLI